MSFATSATASITAQNTYATIANMVPKGAQVNIILSGIVDSTVTLEAQWNQTGSYVVQKTFTANPTEAEHIEIHQPCNLRLGIDTGNYGTDTVAAEIGFDYPVNR